MKNSTKQFIRIEVTLAKKYGRPGWEMEHPQTLIKGMFYADGITCEEFDKLSKAFRQYEMRAFNRRFGA